tara:strand:+ start:1539 stop:2234 length:696 start_codon:yes stop_codon:yes gene_type:complete
MSELGRTRRLLFWIVSVGVTVVTGCEKQKCEQQQWIIDVRLIDGSRPRSFWLQAHDQDLTIGSWWQAAQQNVISDTIVSTNGQPCQFVGPSDLSNITFTGQWNFRNDTSSPYPLQCSSEIDGDSIKLFVSSPFWITLIGGRNPEEISQDVPVMVQCEWCEPFTDGFAPLEFTPGRPPNPTLTLEGWCNHHQYTPFTRTVELFASDDTESILLQLTIETDQIGDTVAVTFLR